MKNLILVTVLIFSISIRDAQTQLIFEKEEYAARRERLMNKIPDGIAIIRGASRVSGHSGQSNNMMYFAGVEIPDVILVIDGERRESILFFTISERAADEIAISLDLVRDPVKITGIENYLPFEDFTSFLTDRLSEGTVVYTHFSSQGPSTISKNEWDGRLTREMQFVKLLNERFPGIKVENCSPYIWNLRIIKSKAEIDIMREAARVGVKAHKAVIKATRPGVEEKKLAAIFEYTCMEDVARELAFTTIIMSADHHAYGHYSQYDRTLEDGDFIILDAGANVDYYDSDISTTFPANGKFSKKQREIYEFSYNIWKVCINTYKPGITLADVGAEIKKMLNEKGYDVNDPKYQRYFRRAGFGHHVGMDVHDPSDWNPFFYGDGLDNADKPLQVGFVIACDIMAQADSVTGVRLEDTVVITEDGCEILSAGLPRSVEEMEAFMKK